MGGSRKVTRGFSHIRASVPAYGERGRLVLAGGMVGKHCPNNNGYAERSRQVAERAEKECRLSVLPMRVLTKKCFYFICLKERICYIEYKIQMLQLYGSKRKHR